MDIQLFSLPIIDQITPYITLRQIGELPLLVINHPAVHAAITLQGAHLITWQPSDNDPVLWLSNKNTFKAGTPVRGGVPICWPWFGSVHKPSHGFARILPWTLSTHSENSDGVVLTLTLKNNAQTQKLWPHDFRLLARFQLGKQCNIELESHGEYLTTAALHSYFAVTDITNINISGLGTEFIDYADHTEQKYAEKGSPTFLPQTNRIYTQPDDCSLVHDPLGKRHIEVHHHYHSDVVIWNPGEALARSMSDMPDNGYKRMVCVETACINKPLNSTGKQPARLAVTLSVQKTS